MTDLKNPTWLNWLKTIDPFSAAYLSSDSACHPMRLAEALRHFWTEMPVQIEPDDLLVGRTQSGGVGGFSFGAGIFCDEALAEKLKKQFPDWTAHLSALVDFWKSREPRSRQRYPANEHLMSDQNVYWAGWGGHTVLGFSEILAKGTQGLRIKIQQFNADEPDSDKKAFRTALLIICDGIDAFAQNYANRARELAATETQSNRKAELRTLAERCTNVPRNPARSFAEALQAFWFIHLLDGADSPGRFDQYLFPYYQRDVAAGILTPDVAQTWLDHLWKRFNDTRSWNLCVGGLRPDGSDGTNDLTFMALEATRRTQKVAPNLSLRFCFDPANPDSNQKLWQKALEVIETGVGMPALYNDNQVIPALLRYGIPETDARNYAMNGCSQVDIQGMSHMGLEDGELNLLKCLELALHNGFDPLTGTQLGPKTGDPNLLVQFKDVWQAYTAQVEFFTQRMLHAANIVQQAHAETSPNLFRSLFVEDCIEKGQDFKAGGPRYNHGQILTQGIANTADSLAVIQKLVFQERRFRLETLVEALDQDFPDESFRQMLLKAAPKFGNDHPMVDSLAAQIIQHFFTYLNTFRTWRGGIFGGGSSVFVRGVSFGAKTGATPDGRKARTPLADSVGPVQGRDVNGPTAMFNSVARIPQVLSQATYVLNVKFTPQVIRANREKIIALFQTYFRNGGQQIQVNVVDAATLRQAKFHPETFQGLIVRVGGYSDFFVRLSPQHQADILARTEQPV
jgi:formate C-acetyltransferase